MFQGGKKRLEHERKYCLIHILITRLNSSAILLTFCLQNCRSTPVRPTVNPYQQKRHPIAQSKLRLLYLIQTLN